MSSACDISSFQAFICDANQKTEELGQGILTDPVSKAKHEIGAIVPLRDKYGTIVRFRKAAGKFYVDVKFTIGKNTYLKCLPVIGLKSF